MFTCFRLGIAMSAVLFVTGCSTPLPGGASPVQATWLLGYHTIPAQYTRDNVEKSWRHTADWMGQAAKVVRPGIKVPAVLYLHGCSGISADGLTYRKLMLKQGYAVFMPDSFARGRLKCAQEGTLSERVDMRTDEVSNALQELKKLSWVDQSHIILMGFSEGGNTVDNWSHPGFKAEIILASACTLNASGTPNAPKNVPVLAIVGANDDYRPGQRCKMTRTIGGSRSIVVPHARHHVAKYTETQEAIKTFLSLCCQK